MSYEKPIKVNHEETLDHVMNYVICAINDSEYMAKLDNYAGNYAYSSTCGDQIPVLTSGLNQEFTLHRNRVHPLDKQVFPDLVRAALWNRHFDKTPFAHPTHKLMYELAEDPLTPKEEPKMSDRIQKYASTAYVQVELLHGRLIETYCQDQLIDLIRDARSDQEDIADLVGDSKRMAKIHAGLEDDIQVYLRALDNLKD